MRTRRLGLLAAMALAACTPSLEDGRYGCVPGTPGACPPGFYCACEGEGCEPLCHPGPGCGDSLRNGNEECDLPDLGAGCGDAETVHCIDCQLVCTRCGNGDVELGEDCDLGAENSDLSDGLCRTDCTLPRCGDLVVDPRLGEECELPTPDVECVEHGYYDPVKAPCTTACRYDFSACGGRCGDGALQSTEVCDGSPPAEGSCSARGYDVGALDCADDCAPDERYCETWGARLAPAYGFAKLVAAGAAPGELFIYPNACGGIAYFDGVSLHPISCDDEGFTVSAIWGDGTGNLVAGGSTTASEPATVTCTPALCSGALVASELEPGDVEALAGTSLGDLWTATDLGLYHSDGTGWTPVDIMPYHGPSSLWAAGPDDLFFTAEGVACRRQAGLLTCSPWSSSGAMTSVRGLSATDVWAVGGQVCHFDGPGWSCVDRPSGDLLDHVWPVAGLGIYATTVAASADADAWLLLPDEGTWTPFPITVRAAGTWGAPDGALLVIVDGASRLNATGWTDRVATSPNTVSAFWGTGPSDAYAADSEGKIQHLKGVAWDWLPPLPGPVRGLWGDGTGCLLAATDAGLAVIAESTCDPDPTFVGPVTAVWGTDLHDLWVAEPGWLRHFDGSWSPGTAVPGTITDLWGSGPDDVVAVGADGLLLQFDGATWTPVEIDASVSLQAVWGSGGEDVWAVGRIGTEGEILYRHDGGWTEQKAPGMASLFDVAGSGPGDVFAVGDAATLLHFDGRGWSPATAVAPEKLTAVWVMGERVLVGGTTVRELARIPRGRCQEAEPIALTAGAATVVATTRGGVLERDGYPCLPGRADTGPERVYVVDHSTDLTAKLTPLGDADLDLVAFAAAPFGCETSACTAAPLTGDRTLTVTGPGRTYLVVDSHRWRTGAFVLVLTASP